MALTARALIFCRVPHGTRGLKPARALIVLASLLSRPARDAWIETSRGRWTEPDRPGRVPHGTRGLKRFRSQGRRFGFRVASRTGRVD